MQLFAAAQSGCGAIGSRRYTHIPSGRYFSSQNLFIPPLNLPDCQDLQIFICDVTHCFSLPQDFFEGPVCLWRTIAGPHLPKMERKQQAALTLPAADNQWGWVGSVWRLCKDLACFFSGGSQQCSKLVVPALQLAAIHTDTQFLPWCCLPDAKKWLCSSRRFNETQIANNRSWCCSNAALWWRQASVELLWRTFPQERWHWVHSHQVIPNVPSSDDLNWAFFLNYCLFIQCFCFFLNSTWLSALWPSANICSHQFSLHWKITANISVWSFWRFDIFTILPRSKNIHGSWI